MDHGLLVVIPKGKDELTVRKVEKIPLGLIYARGEVVVKRVLYTLDRFNVIFSS